MPRAILALLVLISITAWAAPAGAPEPTVEDVIQELIRRSAARNQGRPPKPAAAIPAPAAAIMAPPVASPPPPAPIAAPPAAIAPVVVTAPTEVSIPAEVRDSIVSLCSLLITAGIAAGLAWMRAHFAFMKDVGINASVTSTANGLGALLERELAKQGKTLTSVSISDPTVAAFAQKLVATYPEWGPQVGLTQDIAERKVMAGAIQQSATPIVPAAAPPPAPSPPPPAPPTAVSAAPATATVVVAEAAPGVPTPPMDLEVHT